VERSSGDDAAMENRGGRDRDAAASDMSMPDVSVAVAELPASMSGSHWANRDNDHAYRRPGRSTPFRRPPAENSFPSGGGSAVPISPAVSAYQPSPLSDPADEESTEIRKSRHWTAIGAATRRPRTSDRDEMDTPFFAPEPDDAQSGFFAPTARSSSGQTATGRARTGAVSASASVPAPSGGKASHARLSGKAAVEAEAARVAELGGLLGGSGREIRPHRAIRGDSGAHPQVKDPARGTPAAPPRRSKVFWATAAMVVFVLVGGGAAAAAVFTGKADKLTSVLRAGVGSGNPKIATAPLDGRVEGSFELVSGATQVTMTSEDLGNDLFRITSAADSGLAPRTVVDGNRVQLMLTPDGDGNTGDVAVVLAAKVKWKLRFAGGADEQLIDLSKGQVAGVDFGGGARRVELTLPKPAGTVAMKVTGAVQELVMRSPKDNPVRLKLASGAKTVAAGEKTLRNVEPGATLTPRNWGVADRYDVDVASRVTLASVETTG
jgi:hypothetical protein